MRKVEDLTGQQFDTLIVISRATDQEIQEAGHKRPGSWWWLQCQECGIKLLRSRTTLMGGKCKCLCQRSNLPVDLTGQTFGRLTVVRMATLEERKFYGKDVKRTHCWCTCSCGNPNLLYYKCNSLLTGNVKSCGCLHSERTIEYNIQTKTVDLTGMRFGKLVVKRMATIQERTEAHKPQERAYAWCQCDCGSAEKLICGSDLIKGHTNSCGCLTSYGEYQIVQLLNSYNIPFKTQQTFLDLKGDNDQLKYDFGIYNSNNQIIGLIECDGEFHRQPVFGEEQLQKQQRYDLIKDNYAETHNIPLLRIIYQDGKLDIKNEEILSIIRGWQENES